MVFIVSEIGVNWNGLAHACRMIIAAKRAGADACKFQCFKEEHVKGHPRFKELQRMVLDLESLKILKECADYNHIEFFATPFYPEAVDMLEQINVKRYKVRFSDQYNWDLIRRIEKTKKPFYVSTVESHAFLYPIYCIPKYPPPLKDYKDMWHEIFHRHYRGLSNHYPSMAPALVAVSMGAEYVESHVRDCYNEYIDAGPIDNAVSWGFGQFETFVKLVREMEQIL